MWSGFARDKEKIMKRNIITVIVVVKRCSNCGAVVRNIQTHICGRAA
jgi:recombinational DNA repair protein RecR